MDLTNTLVYSSWKSVPYYCCIKNQCKGTEPVHLSVLKDHATLYEMRMHFTFL